jgi:hypothetical protein
MYICTTKNNLDKPFVYMKLFDFRIFTLWSFLLLFGVVMEGVGQVDRSCIPCSNNGQANQLIIANVNLTDDEGNVIDVDNCDEVGKIFLSFEYTATGNLDNVFFVSDLNIISNIDGDTTILNFDFLVGDLERTRGNSRTFSVEIDLPESYDCKSERLVLTDIVTHWTRGNIGSSLECDDYNNGQCRQYTDPRNVTVDGFFYDFSYVVGCFEENGSTVVTYFITALAGGNGDYNIDWTINNNGTIFPVEDQFIVPVLLGAETDVVSAALIVTDTDGDAMSPVPPPITAIIPDPFDLPTSSFSDNDENIEPFPNGSITVDIDLEDVLNFIFIWTDDLGNVIDPPDPENPTFLTGREEGLYRLTMIDRNSELCRLLEFPIGFNPLPVRYGDTGLNFDNYNRVVFFSWSTTKEWEASHFEVERAVSGTKFEKVGEVKAAGWSDQLTEYLFEDKILPLTGGNLLYRLKQVDFNGDFEYSKVLSVRVPGMQFTSGVWRAFPNPTDGSSLRISLLDASQYNNEPLTFRLIHPTSQTEAISVPSEKEMNEMLADLSIRIPKGVFVVEIQWGQKVEHIKVLKK